MVIGPVVAAVALGLLASIEASEVVTRISGMAGGATQSEHHLAPYLLIVGLFAFVYSYMPNTRVEILAAFLGALFCGVLWAAVGALFARLVVYSTRTMVDLFWICHRAALPALDLHQLADPAARRAIVVLRAAPGAPALRAFRHPDDGCAARAARVVGHVPGRPAVRSGQARWTLNELAERLNVPGVVINEVVTDLEDHGLC